MIVYANGKSLLWKKGSKSVLLILTEIKGFPRKASQTIVSKFFFYINPYYTRP